MLSIIHCVLHTISTICIIHIIMIHYLTKTEEVLTELKHNSKVKFKETDLFRVYQSIDLVSYKYKSLFLCILGMNFDELLIHIYIIYILAGKFTTKFRISNENAINNEIKGCHLLSTIPYLH